MLLTLLTYTTYSTYNVYIYVHTFVAWREHISKRRHSAWGREGPDVCVCRSHTHTHAHTHTQERKRRTWCNTNNLLNLQYI